MFTLNFKNGCDFWQEACLPRTSLEGAPKKSATQQNRQISQDISFGLSLGSEVYSCSLCNPYRRNRRRLSSKVVRSFDATLDLSWLRLVPSKRLWLRHLFSPPWPRSQLVSQIQFYLAKLSQFHSKVETYDDGDDGGGDVNAFTPHSYVASLSFTPHSLMASMSELPLQDALHYIS